MAGERISSIRGWCFSSVLLVTLAGCACAHIPGQCGSEEVPTLADNQSREFYVNLKSKCNPSGVKLEEKKRYYFAVKVLSPVADGRVTCKPPNYSASGKACSEPLGPDGFQESDLPWYLEWILWLGDSARPLNDADARWLELVGRVGDSKGEFFHVTRHLSKASAYEAPRTGELLVLANDFPWLGRYCNNEGILQVTVFPAD